MRWDKGEISLEEYKRQNEKEAAEREQRRLIASLIAASISGFIVTVLWQPMSAKLAELPGVEFNGSHIVGFVLAGGASLILVVGANAVADEYLMWEKPWQISLAPFVVPLAALLIWVFYFNPHHVDQLTALRADAAYFHRAAARTGEIIEIHGNDYVICGRPGRDPDAAYLCSQVDVSQPRGSEVWGSFQTVEWDSDGSYVDYSATDCSGRSQLCDE